jgi:DsbC/DsbD-like thiol-disulfide interchange protein
MKITKQKLALVIFISFIMGNWHLLKANGPEERLQQQNFPDPLVTVKPVPPEKSILPGDSFDLNLELIIAPGYHLNSQKPDDKLLVPTSIEFKKDSAFEVKEIIFPEAKRKKFKFSDKPLLVFEGKIKIKIKIELADNFFGNSLDLEGKVHYQACHEEACLRPASVHFKASIPVSSDRQGLH